MEKNNVAREKCNIYFIRDSIFLVTIAVDLQVFSMEIAECLKQSKK